MTSPEPFRAFQSVRDRVENSSGASNEAQARHDVIDGMLHDVLGWPRGEDSVKVEHAEPGVPGYRDYILYVEGRARAVVEAKRPGRGAPAFARGSSRAPLRTSVGELRKNADVAESVKQTLEYCRESGAPLGVTTDGRYYVVFAASPADGRPVNENQALIFPDLDVVEGHFRTFLDLLSQPSVAQRSYAALLAPQGERVTRVSDSRAVKQISRRPPRASANRSLFAIYAKLVLEEVAVGDVKSEKQFLKDCYCAPGLAGSATALAPVLETWRELSAGGNAALPVPVERGKRVNGRHSPTTSIGSVLGTPGSTVIFAGRVGVGKTTLIRKLLLLDMEEEFAKRRHAYVDLRDQDADQSPGELRARVVDQLYRIVRGWRPDFEDRPFLLKLYRGDVAAEKRSFRAAGKTVEEIENRVFEAKLEDRAAHLSAVLAHSRGSGAPPVIFLDNLDHHGHDGQSAVLKFATSFARSARAVLVVTARPETLEMSEVATVLGALTTSVFRIDPPRVDVAFRRRIKHALAERSGDFGAEDLSAMSAFFRFLDASFDRNEELADLLMALSNDNVRSAYELLFGIAQSPHLSFDSVVAAEKLEPLLSIHDCVRALALGERAVYTPATAAVSPIRPVFNLCSGLSRDENLLPYIISRTLEAQGWTCTRGFLLDNVSTPLPVSDVSATLAWMRRQGFLEATGDDDDALVVLTPRGAYHLDVLSKLWSYHLVTFTEVPLISGNFIQTLQDAGHAPFGKIAAAVLDRVAQDAPGLSDHVDLGSIAAVLRDERALVGRLSGTRWPR